MKHYRIYIASAVSIAALIAVVMLWGGAERYYPLVRVVLPDHSELDMIDMPWADLKSCQQSNRKVVAAMHNDCGQCQITDSCSKETDASFKKALQSQPIDHYVVSADTLRIVVYAGATSKQTCNVMAAQMTSAQKQAVSCVSPL